MELALGSSQPSMKVKIWSKTFSWCIYSALPKTSGVKSSILVMSSAPVAFIILFTSVFLTLLNAMIPALDK